MRSSKRRRVMQVVRRRCLVCEWQGQVDEPEGTDEIGPLCQRCRAPTERLAVLAEHRVAATADPLAAALGRRGGLKGGPARAAALSPTRRREIARMGARARWRR